MCVEVHIGAYVCLKKSVTSYSGGVIMCAELILNSETHHQRNNLVQPLLAAIVDITQKFKGELLYDLVFPPLHIYEDTK
jgi:hypothetical protein